MKGLKILHASDAFFRTKPEEYTEAFYEYIEDNDADLIVFTGNMGLEELPRTKTPTIYVEGDYENIDFGFSRPRTIYIADYTALVIPHTPEKDEETFISMIKGEEVDIIITPSAPLDGHFLNGNRVYEILYDIAYFRSPRIWLSGHYKFFPHYQNTVPIRDPKKKFCSVFGVNTSYGYIEEITLDENAMIKELKLRRIFNGRGRKIF